MTTLDPRALKTARAAYQSAIPEGAWHTDGGETDAPIRAAITAYLATLSQPQAGEPSAQSDFDQILAESKGGIDRMLRGFHSIASPQPALAVKGWTDEMVEAATRELLAHGEFSHIQGNNEPNARIAARAALTAALSTTPATADGWRMTPRMADAGKAKLIELGYTDVEFTDAQKVFEAMIDAAPTATGGR